MSLYGTNMDFRTLYSLDYTPKKGSILPHTPALDSNPVLAPWRQALVPDESMKDLLPAGSDYEDPACILHRARIAQTPDFNLVKQLHRHLGNSVYQKDFCKSGDFESKITRNARIVPLPASWATPVTTQRCSYRDPQSIMGPGLKVQPPKIVYRDNIVPDEKEREILRVRTGDSDYMAGIGALGDFILREKLYGEVKPRGLSVWELQKRQALLDQGILPEGTASA